MTVPQDPAPDEPAGTWGPPPPWTGQSGPVPGYGPGGGVAGGSATGAPTGAPTESVQTGPAQTDTRAVVALVLAVLSFVLLPFVPAVVALVLAGRSRRDIAASGGRLTGAGLAQAARIVAWVNVVLCVLAVLAVAALFALFAVYGFGP
ncbi:MAG TPA: DUF4190 domain-containing protein [Mycobacteriales bacterium]|nr:DUF4190 domain-containing protein [Mycobacteriales bacterium]